VNEPPKESKDGDKKGVEEIELDQDEEDALEKAWDEMSKGSTEGK